MAVILLVDDDTAMLDALSEAITDLGHEALAARSGSIALTLLTARQVDAAFVDLRMPSMDGLELLAAIRAGANPPPIAVLTAYATSRNTIEAMRLGAFDHLTKPIGRVELMRVLNAMLAARVAVTLPCVTPSEEGLIGSSEAIRSVQKAIGRLADSDATVLITGETGTGKELVARAIHDHGARSRGPFVAVNCAAVPTELMETELFGHVKGAFSGAVRDHRGAFREAQLGTLFLDEVGDMDPAMQAKILRALQERVVTPVGGSPVAVDVRIVAATHRDLTQRVADGSFRQDLFYRLNVVPINLPALRERADDIRPLSEHFLALAGRRKRLSADAIAALAQHPWPGNVRELKNTLERASIIVRGDVIETGDLFAAVSPAATSTTAVDWPDEDLPTAALRLEELLIRRALAQSRGNRSEAARLLNIHRQHLYTKMKQLGIEVSDDKTPGVAKADD